MTSPHPPPALSPNDISPSPPCAVSPPLQVDAPKAGTLSQLEVVTMYRQAVRRTGPQGSGGGGMGKALAAAVLDHGFVGIATHLHTVS